MLLHVELLEKKDFMMLNYHPFPFTLISKDDELQGRNWCAASCRAPRKERF